MRKGFELQCSAAIRRAIESLPSAADITVANAVVLQDRGAIMQSLLSDYLVAGVRAARRSRKRINTYGVFSDLAQRFGIRRVPKRMIVDGVRRLTAELNSKELQMGREWYIADNRLRLSPDALDGDKPIALRHLDCLIRITTQHDTTALKALGIEVGASSEARDLKSGCQHIADAAA